METRFQGPDEARRLEFFDSLRCFAILPVLAHHLYSPSVPGGYLGVYLFFPISGFLITLSLERQRVPVFYVRRLFRIYVPLLVLLGVWAWLALGSGKFTSGEIFWGVIDNIFMLRIHDLDGYTLGVLWTIHAEVWFYLLAPWLLFLYRRSGRNALGSQTALILILALGSYALRATLDLDRAFAGSILLVTFDAFAVGILLALWRHKIVELAQWLASRPLCASALFSLIVAYCLPTLGTDYKIHIQAIVALLCGVMIACCLRSDILLDNPLFVRLGRISFSLYLVHGLVLDFRLYIWLRDFASWMGVYRMFETTAGLHFTHIAVVYFGTVLIMSAISFWTFERAGIALGRRLSNRLARP